MKNIETRTTLIARLKDKADDAAWEEFSSYYKDYLEAVLAKYGVVLEERQDIIQNTLLKVWELLPSFEYDPQKGRFRSWLTRVTVNLMKVHLTKENRLEKAISEGKVEANDEFDESLQKEFEREWKSFIAQKAWEGISKQLNDVMRQVFELYMEGHENLDISEKLGVAESTVRVYQKRVREKFKFELSRLERELW